MAIGVEGQYYVQFNISNSSNPDYSDFIDEEDLLSFTLIEETGNVLPTFELSFVTDDETIFPLLNEGNDIEVRLGLNPNNFVSISLAIAKLSSPPQGSNRRLITAIGTLSALDYLNEPNMLITTAQSGIEAMISTAKRTFTIDKFSNVTKSLDKMKWIQAKISDRSFISDTWLHCNLQPSFPALGITTANTFVIKDIKKDLLTPYRWRFTNNVINPNDIYYDGDPVITSNTGLINNWTGYGKQKIQYTLDSDDYELIQTLPAPFMALTRQLAKRAGISSKFDTIGIINGNTDENYWKTFLYNLTYLSSFGTVTLNLSFTNKFIPIQILDQIMYKDKSVSAPNQSTSNFNTGKYYVSRVSRNIATKSFTTVVTLSRESLNRIQNLMP